MNKSYKIVIAGNFNENEPFIKTEYIVRSSSRNKAIEQISKRYSNIWSINVEFLLIRTIQSIFKLTKDEK